MDNEYFDGAEKLKILANPTRISLIKHLMTNEFTNVTEISHVLGIPQSTTSQHISKLRHARIISGKRKGVEIYYELVDEQARAIIDLI